ncbi:hypothetical protein BD410DRAFT_847057 [Rickenella mellea]|uniref:Uncharacterized protein n=1 Tax=Rickenella mellea TaxID=50990 RepID=A0A4Y7PDF9_9AGAM|nr:hypothetical protein BD410DRAFT_847057 [Rickenella mellea]
MAKNNSNVKVEKVQGKTTKTRDENERSKAQHSVTVAAKKGAVTATAATKPNQATKKALQDKNSELETRIATLTAQLEKETAAKAAAQKKLQAAGGQKNAGGELRLRPKGTAGAGGAKGYNLMFEMGLGDNKEKYLAIGRSVRDNVSKVGLDKSKPYRDQPAEDLGRLFALVRNEHKFLGKFDNNWPIAELAKQYLRNHRKAHNKKKQAAATQEDELPDIDDVENTEGSEAGEEENGGPSGRDGGSEDGE